jgi:hypothetical protein
MTIVQPLSAFFLSSYLMSAKHILEYSVKKAEKIKKQAERRVETFETKYGWLNVVNNLSNNDATKWGYFFALPLREFLNLISFRKQSNHTNITNRNKMAFDKLIDALNDFRANTQGIKPFTSWRLKCWKWWARSR